jgi:predicted DNA binding CopG/RHH family protein
MKNSLWEKVKEQAVKQGLTPNAFIVECLQKAVEGQKDVSDKDRLGGYPA